MADRRKIMNFADVLDRWDWSESGQYFTDPETKELIFDKAEAGARMAADVMLMDSTSILSAYNHLEAKQ